MGTEEGDENKTKRQGLVDVTETTSTPTQLTPVNPTSHIVLPPSTPLRLPAYPNPPPHTNAYCSFRVMHYVLCLMHAFSPHTTVVPNPQ